MRRGGWWSFPSGLGSWHRSGVCSGIVNVSARACESAGVFGVQRTILSVLGDKGLSLG